MTPYFCVLIYITLLLAFFYLNSFCLFIVISLFVAFLFLIKRNIKIFIFVAIGAFFFSWVSAYKYRDIVSVFEGEKHDYLLKVLDVSNTSGDSKKNLVKILSVDNEKVSAFNKAIFYTRKITFKHGDVLRGSFVLSEYNLGSYEGNLSYNSMLKNKNIYGMLKKTGSIEKVAYNPFWLKTVSIYLRNGVLNRINKSLESPYNYIIEGFLIGNHQKGIPDDIEYSFRKTGTIHVLVVSGAQVALITSILLIICNWFALSENYFFYVSFVINVLFMLISGADASIVRAVIMMQISLLSKLLKRNSGAAYIMALVAAIMLTYNPKYISDLSFILSYLATFGLVVIQPLVDRRLRVISNYKVREIFSVAISPHILTAPVCMFYFASYSLVSIPANILIAPVIDLIVYVGFAGLLLFPVKPLSVLLIYLCKFPAQFIVYITSVFAGINGAVLSVPVNSISSIITVYFLLYIFLKFNKKYISYYISVLFLLCSVSFLGSYESNYICKSLKGPELSIDFFDVGNGLSVLISTPDNHNILYDAGSDSIDGGGASILKYLRKRGVNKLDSVIISHGHNDHYGAVKKIVENINVSKVYVSGVWSDKQYKRLLTFLTKKQILSVVDSGDILHIGNSEFMFGGIIDTGHKLLKLSDDEQNDNSVTVVYRYGDFVLFLTGDIEENGVKNILSEKVGKVDVMLVPHHGAQNNEFIKLLNKVRPGCLVISSGVKNKHGHPHKSTLSKIRNKKIPYYITARKGTVSVFCDGHDFIVRTRR